MDGYKVKTKSFLNHVKGSGGIVSYISQKMGVDRTTLIAWLNRNPSMWEYIYDEREKVMDIAETKLLGKLNNGEDWAIKFILGSTNRGKQRGYGETPIQVIGKQTNVDIGYKFIIEKPEHNVTGNKMEAEREATEGI